MTAGVVTLLMVVGGGGAAISALVEDEPRVEPIAEGARSIEPAGVPALGQAAWPDRALLAAPGKPPVRQGAPMAQLPGLSRYSDRADRTATREPKGPPVPFTAEALPAPANARAGHRRRPVRPAAPVAPVTPATMPAPFVPLVAAPPARQRPAPPAAVRKPAVIRKPAAVRKPAVTTRTVRQTRSIPFSTRTVRDFDLPWGTREINTRGVAGARTLRYQVTYRGGKEISRRLLGTSVTKQPRQQVVVLGRGDSEDSWQDDDWDERDDCGLICISVSRRMLCPGDDDRSAGTSPAFYRVAPAAVAGLESHPGSVCR